jgi:hypothetical protein
VTFLASQADARCLFGEMPPGEEDGDAPPVIAGDHIGALSDDILHHLLSFLPVQTAVRTCVLARRWRHLWKSTTGLRIVGVQRPGPVQDLVKFLHHLLILRERTVLGTVEIEFSEFGWRDDVHYVDLWTRFAVQWGVRALTLHINYRQHLELNGLCLVSQHLKTLDLAGVSLEEQFLNFSSCPALEDLKMISCNIEVQDLYSRSLKRLSIINCESNRYFQVFTTPSLISLELDNFTGRIPCLAGMELLETARVVLGSSCEEYCLNYDDFGVFCGDNDNACSNCVDYNDGTNDGVILGCISNATHMELISHYDIVWCSSLFPLYYHFVLHYLCYQQ